MKTKCIMTIDEIKNEVTKICKEQGVKHLYLFGSYAKGCAHQGSDVDFIVKGVDNISKLEEKSDEIMTLKTIDFFDYDKIKNPILKESMDKYGKIIY